MLLTDYKKKLDSFVKKVPEVEKKAALRYLARTDLYFLIRYVLKKKHIEHQWLFERCREVQREPNNVIDIWSREHCKAWRIDEQVLTANRGWVNHGDLVPFQDIVFAPSGKPVRVLANTGPMQSKACYRVTTSDKASVICDAGHLWTVLQKQESIAVGSNKSITYYIEHVVKTVDIMQSFQLLPDTVNPLSKETIKDRYIVSVEPVEPCLVNCIQVEGGNYLGGKELIPTHNSTIITNGLSIQDILSSHGEDPLPKWKGEECCIGIFSHTRPIAKGFLREIKYEFESNDYLKDLFPDIFYDNPSKQSPKWSEDDGIIVKRKSNRREATIEAYGLVDGMPTSRHYTGLVYDDVVTDKSVTSPDMIKKTTEAMALSYNLGARGGYKRIIGTFYHYNDTYRQLIAQGTYKLRKYPATHDGKKDGKPVLLSQHDYDRKRAEAISSYIFSCQILLDPVADDAQGFKEEWLRHTSYSDGHGMNKYLLVDPASSKKKGSDYTVMLVIGLAKDGNRYLLDGLRDRLNLAERARMLMELHREWSPARVGYERYGMQSDIEYIKECQDRDNYRFDIIELGGINSKEDRIRRLVGPFESGRFYLPNHLRKFTLEKKGYDLVQEFIDEYKAFPVGVHDDILDAASRIEDEALGAVFPKEHKRRNLPQTATSSYNPQRW